jgi:cell division protease FtsH
MSDDESGLSKLLGRFTGGSGAKRLRAWLLITLALLVALFFWSLSYLAPGAPGARLSLDQMRAVIAQGLATDVTLRDQDSRFIVRVKGPVAGLPANARVFWTGVPSSGTVTAGLLDNVQNAGVRVQVDSQSSKQKVKTVATFLLPLMIFANLLALLMSSVGGGSAIGEVATFGSIGQKRLKKGGSEKPITFKDVAGCDEAVAELAEVRDYLRDPSQYAAVGATPPKGVLLFGPPGCGKTLLAKAVAGEASVAFFSVAGAEFVESLVGVGAARVRDLFARVREAAPAIVFIDELDAAGRRRGVGGGTGGADEREQTLNQLLVEMDGFSASSGIVVIAATNRPDIIDPALLRPGRFDRHVTVESPDAEGRAKILKLHARSRPVENSVDITSLARRTPGFTGADLANVINEAALLAARERRQVIRQEDLDDAVDRVLHGSQRRGRVLEPEERHRLAVHEAGHAIVSAATGRPDDVHRLSILSSGKQLAATRLAVDNDSAVVTRSRLYARLATTLAGTAAEKLVLGEPSSGAVDDLAEATTLARDIVGAYGMSAELGSVRLLASDAEVYLGEGSALGWISQETHETLDRTVRKLVADAEAEAKALLQEHRRRFDDLVRLLLDNETVEGDSLHNLLNGVAKTTNARKPQRMRSNARREAAVAD